MILADLTKTDDERTVCPWELPPVSLSVLQCVLMLLFCLMANVSESFLCAFCPTNNCFFSDYPLSFFVHFVFFSGFQYITLNLTKYLNWMNFLLFLWVFLSVCMFQCVCVCVYRRRWLLIKLKVPAFSTVPRLAGSPWGTRPASVGHRYFRPSWRRCFSRVPPPSLPVCSMNTHQACRISPANEKRQ